MKTIIATVKNGKIELPPQEQLPEGTQITVIIDEPDANFWQNTSHNSLAKIWDNTEDDIYAQLLQEWCKILVRYPFSDLSNAKIRPAIIISIPHPSQDIFITPLTSRTQNLLPGEFILQEWQQAKLNVLTAVKRGIYTLEKSLIIKKIGILAPVDIENLDVSLRYWLGFSSID